MNYKDITVGIVTFKSEKVIFECLKSIKKIKKIIIFDNSYDVRLKNKINLVYPKIKFILSKKNLGYGNANNEIIRICKTKYLFIINPDTILKKNCENELLKSTNIKKLDFSIIAPISQDLNFGSLNKTKFFHNKNIIETDYTKGFAMLINKQKIIKVGMFDKNIFLYLEEIDLCKRLKLKKQKIYVNKKAKIFHKAAKSSNIGFEFEKCRNWHWMWSSVYYKRKYTNNWSTILEFFPKLIFSLFKIIFYFLIFQFEKSLLNYMRFSGVFNALIGKKSWYRPYYK
jgi:N-acetylglucosaminyl-diphospho-decaprenol L-rhamnosyltransferase